MYIIGMGTAAPPRCFTQEQCWQAACAWPEFHRLTTRSRAIIKKVLLGQNGIDTRHFAMDRLEEIFALNPDALAARFAAYAPALATQAAQQALQQAGLSATQIDALVISTCTGYLCPGLTSYVTERLGLRSNILALDQVGQGCGAAVPNLRTADALLASGKFDYVLSVCVEVCTAAFYLDDDPGVLVSACLFGDGAGAAVTSVRPQEGLRPVHWQCSHSLHRPTDRDYLRFEQRGGMLRNILSKDVPMLAAKSVWTMLSTLLSASGLERSQLRTWILHAGGRDILLALKEVLQLEEADLTWSAATLRNYGNISSASVLVTLASALEHQAPGGYWWLVSFGAGFSCHSALLKVD